MDFEPTLPKLLPNERYKYTIRADFCQDFLWVTGENDEGIGKCIGDGWLYSKKFGFSEYLWEKFSRWMMDFEMADKNLEEWQAFDLEGLALTIELKRELGNRAVVQYLCSFHGMTANLIHGYKVHDDDELEAMYLIVPEHLESYNLN